MQTMGRGHVGFFWSDYNRAEYEVVRAGRECFWAPTSNVIDLDTGYRCGLRLAPYDIGLLYLAAT